MIRGIYKLAALWGASFFFANPTYAHFYVDFSIDKVWLDQSCHLNVAVSNTGEGVPVHFYYSLAPVSITITKGDQTEPPLSLTVADRRQALTNNGGSLVITSKAVYTNNPSPVAVGFAYGEEYGDYNQRNNSLIKPIDCVVGQGEIPSRPIVYHQPDIAVQHIAVDAEHCQVRVTLENTTQFPLDESAWGDNGIQLVQKNQLEGSILSKTLLRELDPKQALNQMPQGVVLTLAIPKTQDERISVNAWFVTNDYDFHNNAGSYAPPDHCR